MAIDLPELKSVPADRRQAVMAEAVRVVNETYGKMSRTPHYVGCALAAIVVLRLVLMNKEAMVAVVAGFIAYVACLAVGAILWRRSMIRAFHETLARIDALK